MSAPSRNDFVSLGLALFGVAACGAPPRSPGASNTVSAMPSSSADWEVLFEGGSTDAFRAYGGSDFPAQWVVDGDSLHEGGEVANDLDRSIAHTLVVSEMATNKYKLRAELARPPSRHTSLHSEGLGFVGR